jgi:hypothetical protein
MLPEDLHIQLFLYYPCYKIYYIFKEKLLAIKLLKKSPDCAQKLYFLHKEKINSSIIQIIKFALREEKEYIFNHIFSKTDQINSDICNKAAYYIGKYGYESKIDFILRVAFDFTYSRNTQQFLLNGAASRGREDLVDNFIDTYGGISDYDLCEIAYKAIKSGYIFGINWNICDESKILCNAAICKNQDMFDNVLKDFDIFKYDLNEIVLYVVENCKYEEIIFNHIEKIKNYEYDEKHYEFIIQFKLDEIFSALVRNKYATSSMINRLLKYIESEKVDFKKLVVKSMENINEDAILMITNILFEMDTFYTEDFNQFTLMVTNHGNVIKDLFGRGANNYQEIIVKIVKERKSLAFIKYLINKYADKLNLKEIGLYLIKSDFDEYGLKILQR